MSNKVNNIPQHKTIQATPSTPDTGFGKIYIKNDKLWYGLDDLGVETLLSGGGGGGGIALIDLSAVLPLTYDNSTGSFSINQSSGSSDGFLTLGDWTTFNNKVAGSGTSDTITKWTNSNTIGDSCIKENTAGQSISVGTLATPTYQTPFLTQTTDTHYLGGWFANTHVYSGNKIGIIVDTQGNTSGRIVGIENRAGSQQSPPVDINIGIFTHLGLSSSSLQDYGLYVDSDVTNNTFANIGAYIKSSNSGIGGKYSVQLRDGSEAAGKFLKSITVDGKANWANITAADVSGVQGSLTLTTTGSSGAATLVGTTLNIPQYSGGGGGGVSGSGTLNLIPKWTPNGTTLGNSQINDDATRIWIGQYSGGVKFNVYNNDSSLTYGGAFESRVPGGGVGLSVYGQSSDGLGYATGIIVRGQQGQTNTGLDAGAFGIGLKNTGASLSAWGATENIGAYISAYGNTGSKVGAQIIAQNTGAGTGTLYSVQLQDGTEGAGKFLKSVTSDGKANWASITSSDTQGASGSFVSNDGKTITVTNGLITSIV